MMMKMQQTEPEILQYLNNKTEAILYLIYHHPELPYPEKKMQLYDECCTFIGHRIDPELVFRVARKHNEAHRKKKYSIEREYIYREVFK